MKPHFPFAVFVFVVWCMCGCSPRGEKAAPWFFPPDQYVFIEYRIEEDGRVLEGNYPSGPMIDFPTYMYDPHRGEIASRDFPFEINDTLKVVLGKSLALRGTAGGGISSRLYGAYQLPFTTDDITILRIENDGTARVRLRTEVLVIPAGDEWRRSQTRRDTIGTFRDRAVAEFTKTERIVNHGVLEKAKIRPW